MATDSALLRVPRPEKFGGRIEDYEEWAYKYKAYLNVVDANYNILIRLVEEDPERVITDDGFVVEGVPNERQIRLAHDLKYNFLLSSLSFSLEKLEI